MKIFNTIQELWDYCSFCPVCQKNGRQIILKVGPDAVFTLTNFDKTKTKLNLDCVYKKKNNFYRVVYKIDCLSNLFNITVPEMVIDFPEAQLPRQKVKQAYFYLYIQSDCKKCKCAASYGKDLELEILDKKISNIKLERESFFLLKEKDKFHISVNYGSNYMVVSRCQGLDDIDFEEESGKVKLPLFDFDLSDQAKLVQRIKTLILFS
jgi:hypothetical protein